jgi:putative membrane protein
MYEDEYGHWHEFYWHHMGGLFDIVVLLLVVIGIVCLVQYFLKSPMDNFKKQDSAMDTLKKRYASGEINSEEFAQKKKLLES